MCCCYKNAELKWPGSDNNPLLFHMNNKVNTLNPTVQTCNITFWGKFARTKNDAAGP